MNRGVGLQSHPGIDLTQRSTGEFVSRPRSSCAAGDATTYIPRCRGRAPCGGRKHGNLQYCICPGAVVAECVLCAAMAAGRSSCCPARSPGCPGGDMLSCRRNPPPPRRAFCSGCSCLTGVLCAPPHQELSQATVRRRFDSEEMCCASKWIAVTPAAGDAGWREGGRFFHGAPGAAAGVLAAYASMWWHGKKVCRRARRGARRPCRCAPGFQRPERRVRSAPCARQR